MDEKTAAAVERVRAWHEAMRAHNDRTLRYSIPSPYGPALTSDDMALVLDVARSEKSLNDK